MSATSESLSVAIIAILGVAILTSCGSESSSSKVLDTTTESIRDVRRDESSAKTQEDSMSPEVLTDGTADSQSERDTTATKPNPALASKVVEAPGEVNSRSAVNEENKAVNGIGGTKDVLSRGYKTGENANNYVILSWSGRRVKNGPGDDLIIFENPFRHGSSVFMDLIIVAVSADADNWIEFPHDYTADPETEYVPEPEKWEGFAGKTPVNYRTEKDPDNNPFNHENPGGDAFDIADLPDGDSEAAEIKSSGFKYIKLISAPSRKNPDTGEPYPRSKVSDGFDLDGVAARYVERK